MREFYRETVGIDTDPGLTVSRRHPMEGALQDVGSTLSSISTDYMKRMAREEAESSIAAEDVRAKRSWLEAEVQMSEMSEPKEIAEFYEEWEKGEREAIEGIDTNRLGKRAIGQMSERTFTSRRIKALGAGGFYDQAQIAKNARGLWSVIEHADMGIASDGYDSTQEAVEDSAERLFQMKQIDAKQVEAIINGHPTRLVYNGAIGELDGLREEYMAGRVDPRSYVEEINKIEAAIKEEPLEIGQRGQLNQIIRSRRINANQELKKAQDKALLKMDENLSNETFDPADFQELSLAFGEPYAQIAMDAMDSSFRRIGNSDEDVGKLVSILDQGIVKEGKTPISWAEGMLKINNTKNVSPEMKYVAALLMAENYMEMSEKHGYVVANESWFRKEKMPSDGVTEKLVRGIAYYTARNGTDNKFLMDTVVKYRDWKKTGKYEGQEATEEDMLRGLFKEQAMKFVMGQTSSKIAPAPPSVIDIGFEDDGYRFKGGDPSDQNNWELIK